MTHVYRGYTQDELDAQYTQATLVPDLKPFLVRWERAALDIEKRTRIDRVAYGEHADEYIDVLHPQRPRTGVHVHFHGGSWSTLTSRDAWHIAPPWIETGWLFVSVNYTLVPEASLERQLAQAERGVHYVISAYGGDIGLVISGHSSGAHLAASSVLLGPRFDHPFQLITASGLYDLEPVQLSARNDFLKLDPETANMLSPLRAVRAGVPATVMWSANELDEFRHQGRTFADAIGAVAVVTDAPTHFDTWVQITPNRVF